MRCSAVSVLSALTFLLATACGSGEPAEGEAAPPEGSTPRAVEPRAPAVSITDPVDGAEVGRDVRVVLGADGVDVVPASGAREPGRGHHHLFVDVDLTPAGEPIPGDVAGIIHIGTGAAEHVLEGLAPGEHRVIAMLAHGDHVPMEGVATDTVRFVVRAP